MAAIPVTIRGTITTKGAKGLSPATTEDAIFNGLLSIAGLIVDGGPIIPPPDPPTLPPTQPPEWVKPPPPEGGWGFTSDGEWVFVINPGPDKPGPK